MKIIKAIKLHRKLRIRQEIIFNECILWSQKNWVNDNCQEYPKLNEYASINKAVNNVESKLPNIYFFLSDIFGFYKKFKQHNS